MKHKQIKKYIKLSILLFGFSIVLWNCVDERDFLDDEISEHQLEEYQMRSVKRYEIPERIINFIDQESSGTKQVRFNKSTGGILFSQSYNRSSDDFGIIDESQAVIVPYHGESRYTFLVVPDQPLDNEVINLIVVENDEGIEEYFIKYHFDGSSESRDLSTRSSNDLTSFSGTITYYDKNGNQTGQTTMSNSSTVDTTGDGIPCPPDEEPDPNDDPNNNTTNGGNTTGNGGQAGNGNQPGDGVDPTHDDNSGGGDLVDPDQCTVITNHICSEGDAEPHGSECVSAGGVACAYMCGGTFTTITDHCTGSSITFRTTSDDLVAVECENTVGVIFEKEDCDTSKEDLKKIFPNASDSDMELLASVINDKGTDFGIDTALKLQHFLAQAGHEVGGFNNGIGRQESLYYTTESRLKSVYKNYFWQNATDTINKRNPADYIKNSSKVANYVYADRMGNGDESSGEGFKYRGRGIFQLTGKTNYTNFKTWYNNKYDPDKDFVDKPELLKDNDTMAILSAMWYYKTEVLDRITVDSTATVKEVTKKINGGTNGLTDRESRFTKAKDSIKCN